MYLTKTGGGDINMIFLFKKYSFYRIFLKKNLTLLCYFPLLSSVALLGQLVYFQNHLKFKNLIAIILNTKLYSNLVYYLQFCNILLEIHEKTAKHTILKVYIIKRFHFQIRNKWVFASIINCSLRFIIYQLGNPALPGN